eukprot:CAMPEP_0116541428 /NCGR_PEP_ID=MMETSP0397-20121206/476_1 /TAXON_ID=216820 /ORGANISM="Cyclophora tenuis, Strain ECT3854" /LENGTH=132 /DNA_ID=CAMNT_0004065367 /DNA_START=128 /DNA_END=523 /DNA_ORIENTATION=+
MEEILVDLSVTGYPVAMVWYTLQRGLSTAESKREAAAVEAASARQEAQATKELQQELEARCKKTETALGTAEQQIADSGTDEQLRANIEKLKGELTEARAEVATLEERAKNFENLSKANEARMRELTASSEA